MVIIYLYISENTSTRCRTKLDFDVTYRFGCKTCNSAPLLLKIGANEVYSRGVSVAYLSWLQPFFISPVQSGFHQFLFSKRPNRNWSGSFFSVRFGPVSTFFQFYELDLQTLEKYTLSSCWHCRCLLTSIAVVFIIGAGAAVAVGVVAITIVVDAAAVVIELWWLMIMIMLYH